jgi:hypothetical protein
VKLTAVILKHIQHVCFYRLSSNKPVTIWELRLIWLDMYQRFASSISRVTEACTLKLYTVNPSETLVLNQIIRLYNPLNTILCCCILSFGWFHGVWIFCADVSEHSVCYIFIGDVSILPTYTTYEDEAECSETSAHKIQTPGNHPQERIQHLEHGENLKSRIIFCYFYNSF